MDWKGKANPRFLKALMNASLLAALAAGCNGGASTKAPAVGMAPQVSFQTESVAYAPRDWYGPYYDASIGIVKDQNPQYGLDIELNVDDDNFIFLELKDNGAVAYSRQFDGAAFVGYLDLTLTDGVDHRLQVLAKDADGNRSYAAVTIGADGKVSGLVEPERQGAARMVLGLGGPYSFEDSFATASVKGTVEADLVPRLESVEVTEKMAEHLSGMAVVNAYMLGGDEPLQMILYQLDPLSGKTIYSYPEELEEPYVEKDGSAPLLPQVRRMGLIFGVDEIPCGGIVPGIVYKVAAVDGEGHVLDERVLRITYEGCGDVRQGAVQENPSCFKKELAAISP